MLEMLKDRPASKVLDLGCSDGRFGGARAAAGHHVTGVDYVEHRPTCASGLDDFYQADLDDGHSRRGRRPTTTWCRRRRARARRATRADAALDLPRACRPGGQVAGLGAELRPLVPPGSGHARPVRLRPRGILDQGHLRFFTRRSFERLVRSCGMRVVERDVVGVPVDVLERGGPGGRVADVVRVASRAERGAAHAWPTLFGYQLLYRLAPA